MKNLFEYIKEGILSNDEKVTQDLVGEEATAHFNYQLFMDYVGDLLYKKAPYASFPTYVVFELSRDLQSQNCSSGYMYDKCEKSLIKYFEELKKIHKEYTITCKQKVGKGFKQYELTFKNKQTKDLYQVKFVVRNFVASRRINVEWDENKPFMLP